VQRRADRPRSRLGRGCPARARPGGPGQLVAAATAHLPTAGGIGQAVHVAAGELGIDDQVALQLAGLAGDRCDPAPATTYGARLPVDVTTAAASASSPA
jgi:hypothetical protein